ncbi:sensor histidine kinase [Chamaesiphon polymorphus]|uniref:histidine kinase n=1 Tax=Chamaesiphon polymorphus CCALA 037 TaxID=2107692 RepID=A0A2T1FP91_9CYAN|nr:HAMP domain-containing sensor histidine kinase [Chamaesiphon polymorphus]PSB46786.1 two-component sensor histidine kinase [Chamaesiphon polymorphus CCALA 037]
MALRTNSLSVSEQTPHQPQQTLLLQSYGIDRFSRFWVTVGLFGIVFALELLTPADYVMGYLYISPILFFKPRLHRGSTIVLVAIAVVLTLLNIWIPGKQPIQPAMVANRLITVVALIVTGLLSDRNRYIQQTLAQQQAKLQVQEQLASLREDFTSTLAHDLKTPILGAIETLKAFDRGQFGEVQPKQKHVLGVTIRSHQTTLQLVETLLDVYRNDIEGLHLRQIPIDLSKLAESAATALFDLAASRRVHLSLNYGNSEFRQFLWVNGDAFQLERVFANLIANAINHSPRGAKVEIVLSTQGSQQVVKIADTGAGIQPDEMTHLFGRFYQGESDRQASGSGLGLYLARQIVEAHGGTIWAENRSPQGAIFGFRLPAIVYPAS